MIIDVELLEVDRTRLQEYGLQIASPGSPGLNGVVGIAPDSTVTPPTISLQSLRNLSSADVLFANLPNHIRVSVASHQDMPRVIDALNQALA